MALSFLLMLDTSGSMYGECGEKIHSLNTAAAEFLEALKAVLPEPELAVITFGGPPSLQNFAPVSQITLKTCEAGGKTPLTEAVVLAAGLFQNIDSNNLITVLISDGAPDDGDFRKTPLPGLVYALSIGLDADYEQLSRFTGSSSRVLPPHEARSLPGYALQKGEFTWSP